ncbi:unnamed protein product [Lymnaea stagnalis]|uniref:C-type lectin domain-containing protein n=1 Tax=Lymnaea stagnalis TaxID=6523 RepID=A0AAV2IR80_LYMST
MVVCDASKGLQIFTSGKSMSCLGWFNNYVTYFEAEDACRSKGGYLMTPKTMDKVAMLLPLVTERAWVGLDDTKQEGVYIWKDDNSTLTLTADVKSTFFASGEPNNNGDREDCNVYTPTLLNDVPCWFNYTYLCEIFTVDL